MLDNQWLICLQCGGKCVENCSVSVEFFHTHATIVWFLSVATLCRGASACCRGFFGRCLKVVLLYFCC